MVSFSNFATCSKGSTLALPKLPGSPIEGTQWTPGCTTGRIFGQTLDSGAEAER